MFIQQAMALLAAQPGLTAITLAALVPIAVLTALVAVAALVAILAGHERGDRARLVLSDLLGVFRRGGQQ
ncbi:hypothetical protein ACIBJI_41925 [Nocardia sp. NPDC050408]|uniref:hypothetical protein n=1 Tax=Nocardia sp. NPDC050408 TaxID=3364319 RepID=UPI00379C9866